MKIDMNNPVSAETISKQQKAAKDMESYFIGFLMKEMRKTIPKTGLLGENSFATDYYNEMMDQQIAANIADNGGFGLAKSIMNNTFNQKKGHELYRKGGDA